MSAAAIAALVAAVAALVTGVASLVGVLRKKGKPKPYAVRAATQTSTSQSFVIVDAVSPEAAVAHVRSSPAPSLAFYSAAEDLVATPATPAELGAEKPT